MSDEILIKHQDLPTYLRVFLTEQGKCTLIHRRKALRKKSSHSNSSNLEQSLNESLDSECDHDLTGNPLQIDLNISALNSQVGDIVCSYHNWSLEECQHYPLSLEEARKLLNEKFNSKISSEPVFCITNPSDLENIYIIGSQNSSENISTYLVRNQEIRQEIVEDSNFFQSLIDEQKKFSYLKPFKETYNVRKLCKINRLSMEHINELGGIFTETSWKTPHLKETNTNEIQLKFMMKVRSGHSMSKIHYLWKELQHLGELMNILNYQEASIDENTVLSPNSQMVITDLVNNICQSFMKIVNIENNMEITSINFSKLEDETHLDKLWQLLNACHSVKDLQCFWSIFFNFPKIETIIQSNNDLRSVLQLYSSSKLNHFECLKLMIDVGFQKLKKDYFIILNHYFPSHQTDLMEEWSKKVHCGNEEKLQFLIKLHDVSELLAFFENSNVNLTRINFNSVIQEINNKYLMKGKCREHLEEQCLEINCVLCSDDTNFYEKTTLLSTSIEISSFFPMRKMRTIVHISQKPIFPPVIYQPKNLEGGCSSMFVAKMHISTTLKKEK